MRKALLLLPLFLFLIYQQLHIDFPTSKGEYRLFFKESHHDLKYIFCKSLRSAKSSIFLASFGLNDPDIKNLLLEKRREGVDVELQLDPRDGKLSSRPYKGSGIMHEKIALVDGSLILLGSTNMTASSLHIHRNMLLLLYHPLLAKAVGQRHFFKEAPFTYYPLPIYGAEAKNHLLSLIERSVKRISVAMYTLTHAEIVSALIRAHERGVNVRIYLDLGMTKGASKKQTARLEGLGIFVAKNLGVGLLHHKCALIDNHFVLGSANWTLSGFKKNQELLLFIEPLSSKSLIEVESFFHSLHQSSKDGRTKICLA